MAIPELRVRHRGLLPEGLPADPDPADEEVGGRLAVRVRVLRRTRKLHLAVSGGGRPAQTAPAQAGAVRARVKARSGNATGSHPPARTRH